MRPKLALQRQVSQGRSSPCVFRLLLFMGAHVFILFFMDVKTFITVRGQFGKARIETETAQHKRVCRWHFRRWVSTWQLQT